MGKTLPTARIFTHLFGLLPATLYSFWFFSGRLGVNPVQSIQQASGQWALNFLLLSLACTPIAIVTGNKKVLSRRQALGNYGYFYATSHFLIFIGVDYQFNLNWILADVRTKMYILIGLSALLLLSPLAVTSLVWFKKRMGKNWKKLHLLAYLIPAIVIWHYFAASKGNLFTLQGNITKPLVYLAVYAALLIIRLPIFRRFFNR